MLVGVAAILGSEVVLSPVVSGCLPSCGGGCWLVWSASWALKWSCLPLSPVVSLHVGGGCWLLRSASWALKWSCLPLSPIVSGCLPSCGGWVLVGVAAILGSEVVLSPVVSGCLPSCGGWVLVAVVGFLGSEVVLFPVVSRCLRLSPFMWGGGGWLVWSASWALKWSCLPLSPVGGRVLVGVAASRTETFRDQNHRLQSKFAYCKLFGVYAGVIFKWVETTNQRSILIQKAPKKRWFVCSVWPLVACLWTIVSFIGGGN